MAASIGFIAPNKVIIELERFHSAEKASAQRTLLKLSEERYQRGVTLRCKEWDEESKSYKPAILPCGVMVPQEGKHGSKRKRRQWEEENIFKEAELQQVFHDEYDEDMEKDVRKIDAVYRCVVWYILKERHCNVICLSMGLSCHIIMPQCFLLMQKCGESHSPSS